VFRPAGRGRRSAASLPKIGGSVEMRPFRAGAKISIDGKAVF
jgi:hypothetical protein